MNRIKDLIKNNGVILIGVTGGVGCGKSSVVDYIQKKYGASVYKADDIGREIMNIGEDAYLSIVEEFGDEILLNDKNIDRNKLAAIVFNDETKLKNLNSIIHPAVEREIMDNIYNEYVWEGQKLFVIEAALLIEAGYKDVCSEIWYVYSDIDTRIERLISSRGYTKEKCLEIMSNQLSDEEFRANSDYILNNVKDFDNTKFEIEKHMNFCYNYNY